MKRLPALSVAFAAVGLFVSATAHADLQIDEASSAPVMVAPALHQDTVVTPTRLGHLTQKGTPLASAPIKGWAHDVALVDALQQIVPDGWTARKVGAVDIHQSVSWKGGKSWTGVLDDLASTYGLDIVVNWNTHTVSVAKGTASAPDLTSIKTLHGTTTVSTDGIRMTTVTSTKPIGSVALAQTWVLSKRLSLRENIEAWAKTAGWTVSWGAVDYPIVADVTLSGPIDADNGPIATVMKAYEDADQPLVARVSEANHVIRVENRDYQQAPVTGTPINASFPTLPTR